METPLTSPKHVVFITGFMCDERLFRNQTQRLTRLAIPYSVEKMTDGSTIGEFAQHLLNTSPSQFALVGLSMGGIVALEVMNIAPERVSHLALLNTTPYEDKSLNQRKDHIRRVQNGELTIILRDELKPKYLSPATSRETLLPVITNMGRKLGVETFVKQSIALMIRKSAVTTLAAINCPTSIITGADDLICPPSIHKDMARHIAGSRLHIIPDCGHLSPLEAPESLNKILFEHWGFHQSNILCFAAHTRRVSEKI